VAVVAAVGDIMDLEMGYIAEDAYDYPTGFWSLHVCMRTPLALSCPLPAVPPSPLCDDALSIVLFSLWLF